MHKLGVVLNGKVILRGDMIAPGMSEESISRFVGACNAVAIGSMEAGRSLAMAMCLDELVDTEIELIRKEEEEKG